jgi:hypothetical protein
MSCSAITRATVRGAQLVGFRPRRETMIATIRTQALRLSPSGACAATLTPSPALGRRSGLSDEPRLMT